MGSLQKSLRSGFVLPLIAVILMTGPSGVNRVFSSLEGEVGAVKGARPGAGAKDSAVGDQEAQKPPASAKKRRKPAAAQADSTRKRPSSQARPASQERSKQPARQAPRERVVRKRRPSRPATPPIKTYSSGELKAIASDITSLSSRLAALNRRTTRRLSRLAPPDSLPRGRRYRFAGDYRRWQQLVRQHEDHPEELATLVALADLQRRNHKHGEAEVCLQKALALEPLSQELLFDLGNLYLEKGENTKAWGTFQEIIYLNPESVEARLAQARVRENEGSFAEAMVIYTRVEEQFGAVAGVYDHRALNLAMQGDYGAAVALAREGLALYPDHAPFYYARGKAYAGLGLLDRAKTDFYDALSLDADLLEAYAALGEVSLQDGNAATAIRVFLRLLDERPGDAAASLNLGRAYLMDLRFQEAVAEWEMLRYLHPDNRAVDNWLPQAYYLHSLEIKARGRFREALEAHHKAMLMSKGQPPGWVVTALNHAGQAARARDEHQRSIDYYHLALENDPFCAESYVGLSRTYGAMQDSSRAHAALQRALAIDPDHPTVLVEINRIARP